MFTEGLREGERVRWGDGSWGRGLEDGGVRLRGRSLGESGEGLREAARAYLERRFWEGILGRRRLEARFAFREEVFSRRFRFFCRCRGGIDARGVGPRASDVTTTRAVGRGREAQHQPEREVGAHTTEVTIQEVVPSVLYATKLVMGGSIAPRRKEGRAAFGVGRRAISFRDALNGGRQTRQVGIRRGQ